MEFVPLEQARQQIICPFCNGNEEETPQALVAYRSDGSLLSSDDDQSSWTTRVIPNRYPSFSENGQPVTDDVTNQRERKCNLDLGPYQSSGAPGIQELVIPSPRHVSSLSELTDEELTLSFKVYQQRLAHAESLEFVKHAMLFMNCRLEAGASLGHIHTQLIGSPVVSANIQGRTERCRSHYAKFGLTLLDSVANWEIEQEARIIELTEDFCVVCPFASRFAFQVWIIPRKHKNFQTCPPAVRDELARHCQTLVSKFDTLLDNPGYNMLLHASTIASMQKDQSESSGRDFYFELFPRLTRAAGFEWGTDIWVNPIAPEAAARRLRV